LKNKDDRPDDAAELRQRAEEALRESKERHRTILQTAMDGFWLADTQGRLLEVNEAYCWMSGYSESELLTMRVSDLEVDETADDTAAHVQKIIAQGEDRFESRHRRKDGSVFDVDVRVQHRPIKGGLFVAFFRDITERKRTGEALRKSEERYQRITEATTDYIYTVRVTDGRAAKTTHGPGCLAVTGYGAKEFVEDPFLWVGMVVPEDRPGIEEQARRILTGEDTPPIEHRIVHKNGTVRWVRNTFVPHRDEHGVLVSYDGLIQDITERKRAEAALRKSEMQLQATLESTADGILAVDNKGKVLHASTRFIELWKIPESILDLEDDQAMLNFVLDQLTDPDAFLKRVQLLYGSDDVDMDTVAFRDGRFFERYSIPMNMDGVRMGRVWSFRDITGASGRRRKRMRSRHNSCRPRKWKRWPCWQAAWRMISTTCFQRSLAIPNWR
jgi:PAS domain S-box-containing protein